MCGQNIRLSKLGYFCILSLSCLLFFYFRGFSITQLVIIQNNDSVSLRRLLLASIQAARLGGIKVKNIRMEQSLQVKTKGHTKEGANDLVTLGDMLSHKAMYFGLKREFPGLHIVSEEVSESDKTYQEESPLLNLSALEEMNLHLDSYDNLVPNEDITVWIDPLDATQEYTENLTEFVTTMVCVAVKGKAIIGVIHLPFKDQTVWAWNGHSSNIHYSLKTENVNSHMKVIVSRSHSGKVKEIAKIAFGKNTEIITAGGAGYKSLLVARREVDAYVHITAIKKWDICAGNAIIKQLGGDMTDLKGNEINFLDKTRTDLALNDGLVATFQNHREVVAKLKDFNLNKTG
ncbi:inositol monophosphatase 3 isoform X3 [Hydra vulgaris]|uniref:inositol-phosphate phosphatase n=1 Tax=Hydra vulgaris TaxID=6087 RepID=A0ABM4D1P9_HYDVU